MPQEGSSEKGCTMRGVFDGTEDAMETLRRHSGKSDTRGENMWDVFMAYRYVEARLKQCCQRGDHDAADKECATLQRMESELRKIPAPTIAGSE